MQHLKDEGLELKTSHIVYAQELEWKIKAVITTARGATTRSVRGSFTTARGATAFVLTASYDKTAKLWSTVTGQCTQTFSGHADAVSTEGARAWLLHGTLL